MFPGQKWRFDDVCAPKRPPRYLLSCIERYVTPPVWDFLSSITGAVVGLAGLYFGWLTSKDSRRQAERLAAQANEHARLLSEQSNAHARQMEEERRIHADRLVENERRHQQVKEAYVQIMRTVRLVSEKLNSDQWSPEDGSGDQGVGLADHIEDLAQASALADTFASHEVLRLFESWREIVAAADQASERMGVADDAGDTNAANKNRLMWRWRLRDLRLRSADARQALADAVSKEVGARRTKADESRTPQGKRVDGRLPTDHDEVHRQ